MGRRPGPDPDLEELTDLEDEEIPGEHVVRRFLVTHERSDRGLPRRPREAAGRRRKPGRHQDD